MRRSEITFEVVGLTLRELEDAAEDELGRFTESIGVPYEMRIRGTSIDQSTPGKLASSVAYYTADVYAVVEREVAA